MTDVNLDIYAGEVHALMGENGAGKSTLMNILSGVFPPSEGQILLEGREITLENPKDAQEKGIAIVHQELSLCPDLSVSENIYMGRMPVNQFGIVNQRKLYQQTKELLAMFKTKIDPSTPIGELSVSEQQVVEIAKALSFDCKVLILDEPTSAITESEANRLFEVMLSLKQKGIALVYISHKFNEIFSIADRISVLRDGHDVGSDVTPNLTPDKVVSMMVGRELTDTYPDKVGATEKELLRVEKLEKEGVFHDIQFSLYQNEILGIFGLMGAGRTEMVRALCGIDDKDDSQVWINEKQVDIHNINEAKKHGLVYLTEDRKSQGLFLDMTIKGNIISADLNAVSAKGFIQRQRESQRAQEYAHMLNVKMQSVNQDIGSLSGGNQQKALIGKWLSIQPQILILDEPTRGIDVGAKAEIYKLLRSLSTEGKGVMVISSELPEIIGLCDRVLVMHEGAIVGEVQKDGLNEKDIMTLASGIS
nr:sugar ABC transporter ATP-binding protein [Caldalkalibacillus salinus]